MPFNSSACSQKPEPRQTPFPNQISWIVVVAAWNFGLKPDSQQLAASFGHGDFFFDVKPADSTRLEIGYRSDIVAARKAFVQLPLIFFRDADVQPDGVAYDGSSSVNVRREITIRNPTAGAQVRITVPQGKRILLRQPVDPRRWYVGEHKDQRYKPYYQIALLSLELEPAAGQSAGSFVIEVSPESAARAW